MTRRWMDPIAGRKLFSGRNHMFLTRFALYDTVCVPGMVLRFRLPVNWPMIHCHVDPKARKMLRWCPNRMLLDP